MLKNFEKSRKLFVQLIVKYARQRLVKKKRCQDGYSINHLNSISHLKVHLWQGTGKNTEFPVTILKNTILLNIKVGFRLLKAHLEKWILLRIRLG